jgi:hypothetical protein
MAVENPADETHVADVPYAEMTSGVQRTRR